MTESLFWYVIIGIFQFAGMYWYIDSRTTYTNCEGNGPFCTTEHRPITAKIAWLSLIWWMFTTWWFVVVMWWIVHEYVIVWLAALVGVVYKDTVVYNNINDFLEDLL